MTIEINNYMDLVVVTEDRHGHRREVRDAEAWRLYWMLVGDVAGSAPDGMFVGTLDEIRDAYIRHLHARGMTEAQMAQRLGIATRTVRNHMRGLGLSAHAVKNRRYNGHFKRSALKRLEKNGGNVSLTSTETGVAVATITRWYEQHQQRLQEAVVDGPTMNGHTPVVSQEAQLGVVVEVE